MSINWRDRLEQMRERTRKRRQTAAADRRPWWQRSRGGWNPFGEQPLEGGQKTPTRRKRRRRVSDAPQQRRTPRARTTRRTPGGTPAQRAWRQRFGELSRAGQLRPRRRNPILRS